jgi:hypothetical protein
VGASSREDWRSGKERKARIHFVRRRDAYDCDIPLHDCFAASFAHSSSKACTATAYKLYQLWRSI